ncbi:hypothetical protein EYF80_014237 [Liparis tanakae]|uniref:Uncharacterized protein n=1 Tax=Liparis tanakae TaxID=230148 RepID=A0A4Z2ID39_9TELE|nr:hypothetical protein EYF80_014237 [Liparis tanakae]
MDVFLMPAGNAHTRPSASPMRPWDRLSHRAKASIPQEHVKGFSPSSRSALGSESSSRRPSSGTVLKALSVRSSSSRRSNPEKVELWTATSELLESCSRCRPLRWEKMREASRLDQSQKPAACFPQTNRAPDVLAQQEVFISSIASARHRASLSARSTPRVPTCGGVPPCPRPASPRSPQVDGQGRCEDDAKQHQEGQPGLQKGCTAENAHREEERDMRGRRRK